MKKTIAILLVLAVVLTGAFAALNTPSTVTLKSTVDGGFLFGVSKTTVATQTVMPTATPYQSAVEFDSAFTTPAKAYFGYVTNNTYAALTVTVTAAPFVNDSVSTEKVGYTVSGGASAVTVAKDGESQSVDLGFSKLTDKGLRQEETVLTFTATAADVNAAAAGDYTATITFNITNP